MTTTTTTTTYTVVPSPVGELVLTAESGSVTRVGFAVRTPIDPAWRRDDADSALAIAQDQLGEYFAGDRQAFDLPLAPAGTLFQRQVWEALASIPYGEVTSYAALAERVGRPGSARAVGAANGANPLAVVVPCHRVVGADGTLTGYAGGLPAKRRLLALEGHRFSTGTGSMPSVAGVVNPNTWA
jgi:methylated-DNA-[protein]-cysteine S-methyltransferase